MLELQSVRKTFIQQEKKLKTYLHYLFNASFESNKIHGVFGPTGIGKTTLFQILAGFIQPDSGEVLYEGQSLLELSPSQRPIYTIFQDHNLFYHLTAQKNIDLAFSAKVLASEEYKQHKQQLTQFAQLEPVLSLYPYQISGGQKQLVALIRSLLLVHFRKQPLFRSALLIFDEPFNGLDPEASLWVQAMLKKGLDDFPLSLIYSSHDANLRASFSEQIWELKKSASATASADVTATKEAGATPTPLKSAEAAGVRQPYTSDSDRRLASLAGAGTDPSFTEQKTTPEKQTTVEIFRSR